MSAAMKAGIAFGMFVSLWIPGVSSEGVSAQSPEIRVVADHLDGNQLGIRTEDLRSLPNPRGEGTFVYSPQTRFAGVERRIIWIVLEDRAIPLNGATKGSVTPDLPWPREVPEPLWSRTGLSPYSATEALEIVFGDGR